MSDELNGIYGVPISGNNFQYNPNPYGYEDEGIDYSTYPMGMMGMGGSIFGASPMMMGGMYGTDPQSCFDTMRQYQKLSTDYNIEQQKLNRNADMRINASMEAIKNSASVLQDKIQSNEQGQIEEAYNNYLNAVSAAYGEGTPAEIAARAKTLYTQMTGSSITQDIRQHGHGSATQGFIQSLTFGLYNSKSAEDNVSMITGAPVGTGEKTKHNLGRLAGAATVGAIAGGIAHACKSGKAKIIGLVAGGVAAAMSFITGKITT